MFSIITPTYNRAHTLARVYNSLISQTYKNFEWIIIDDASNDGTEELVRIWINQNLFKITYHVLNENKGKPFALNFGFEYCQFPITIIADSDDEFTSDTLSDLKILWDSVNNTEHALKIATIWTLVIDENNTLVGESFPYNFWQVDLKNRILNRENEIKGEKWHSWRTDILKTYKMYHNDSSFISESATWNNINKKYDFLCVNIFHRKYFHSPDGLILKEKTRIEIEKKKYYNSYYQLKDTSIKDILRYKYYWNYAFDYIHSRLNYKDQDLKLDIQKHSVSIILTLIFLPIKIISFLRYKLS
ncbi:glycosyltransferase family 2 protein [Maribacter sp. Asnod1-A12]|uniref:glycosyltransferase family 2 protein n=1 Tax=Maribacter sp. Asnod1-A12 TaxID=3160576 RepID=UPI00386FC56F